jgi:hypothetical protein
MVKKALICRLESGNLIGEDLYNLDDTSLFTLLGEKSNGSDDSLVNAVLKGKTFVTAAEISHEKVDLASLRKINNRALLEDKLAAELRRSGLEIRGEDIIIDIPEPVSFETGLYVQDEGCNFSDSSSAFKTETVNAFIQTLYTIRIYFNQKYKETIKTFPQIYDILKK